MFKNVFSTKANRYLSLSLVAALTGCMTGPDYEAPDYAELGQEQFVSADMQATKTSLPDQWWLLYDDAALNKLVDQALAANTDLRVAEANLARARAIFEQATSDRLPSTTVSAGANYGRDQTRYNGSGKAPEQWSYSGALDIAYEVDLFGRVQRNVEAAEADLGALSAAWAATQLVVVAETTRAYLDACTLGQSIHVAEQSVSLAEQNLKLVKQQLQVGAASQLEAEQAEMKLAQAKAVVPGLNGQRQNRLFELSALMGLKPSEVPMAASQCTEMPTTEKSLPVGDGVQLLKRRPDVQIAERQLAGDTARIGVATASLYPRVVFGASASYFDNDNISSDQTWSFSLGPLISWSFPNRTAVKAQVEQAKAQAAASLANFDGTILTALKETEQALVTYNMTENEYLERNNAHQAASRAFDLAKHRYDAGAISYMELLAVEETLLVTEAELLATRQRLGSDRVSLFLALGGGWSRT